MTSRAVSVFVFGMALLGSGTLFSGIRPFAGVPAVQEKFDWFAVHRDDYDTLFIGSSRIYHGINPAVFDELTTAAGVPTRSFNFGIDGMFAPENAYILEHLAALRPKNLRWVLIENSGLRPSADNRNPNNPRRLHWHDTARTTLMCRALLAPGPSQSTVSRSAGDAREGRWPLIGAHLRLWLTRMFNPGRGALLVQSYLRPPPRPHLTPILGRRSAGAGRQRNGFVPIVGGGLSMAPAARADYERGYAELIADRLDKSFLDRDSQSNLDGMFACVGAFGARPIVVVAPSAGPRHQYPQPSGIAPVLDYNDTIKLPALFQIENRVDRAHLNATGADAFTHTLAADFINLVGSRR
jgi:hypothetical protein